MHSLYKNELPMIVFLWMNVMSLLCVITAAKLMQMCVSKVRKG